MKQSKYNLNQQKSSNQSTPDSATKINLDEWAPKIAQEFIDNLNRASLESNEINKLKGRNVTKNNLLERAIQIAIEAHAGQTDKAGEPYILHPLRVMFSLDAIDQKIVGVLHDVVEDCKDQGWTFERLEKEGFSPRIIDAIRAISKLDGEDLDDYLKRVESNRIALAVKLKDLKDNMDMTRISNPTDKDLERVKRYTYTLQRLKTQHCKIDGSMG
jgi:(p)ppGpp synthase/HD superfamily hydrolase